MRHSPPEVHQTFVCLPGWTLWYLAALPPNAGFAVYDSSAERSTGDAKRSLRPAARAKARFDAWESSQCRGWPAFRPLEPSANSGPKTPRSGHRARTDSRPLPCHRPVRWHAVGADPVVRGGLHDRDVRDRFDHGSTPLRPVLHSARSRHPRDRQRIPLYGVSDCPVCPRVSRGVGSERRRRRVADDRAPVPPMALWIPTIRDRLCLVEGPGPEQTVFATGGPCSDFPKCRLDGGRHGGPGASVHPRHSRVAAHHARSVPVCAGVALCGRCADCGAVHSGARRALAAATIDSRSVCDGGVVGVLG